jgi:3-methylcrotonyl-CoA carboxylase alpha subunit
MPFRKVLIANRGEIAARIARACRELHIGVVAVYSEADRHAYHVRHADEAYLLGPAPASESYLNVAKIIDVAQRAGVEAIHPGYGFLSERAHFARACRDAGLVFIGPSAEAIDLMGSKIAAKHLAQSAGVPTAPGYNGSDQSLERLRYEAEMIGFPLLVKASAGGGGKGMRAVAAPAEFAAALEGAQREALAAFGDATVLLEKLILQPRHVEIQVLADSHGNVVHLFERECSIQRRHQKIVEESPSPVLHADVRTQMGAAAVRLARSANYVNAGTIEFLLDANQSFYFLEMNTRLQVEHPVTELVTGLDLVKLQCMIAAGHALHFTQEDLTQKGHAIEMRVYAEDPTLFLPSIGRLQVFDPPLGEGIRNDQGVASGDEVTPYYDPMLAKLIVSGPDRTTAIARLQHALDHYGVLGVSTNLPLLRAIAAHPAFAAGATTTAFLNDVGLAGASFGSSTPDPEVLIAAALWRQLQPSPTTTNGNPWQQTGWRMLRLGVPARFQVGEHEHLVLLDQLPHAWHTQIAGQPYTVSVVEQREARLTLRFNEGRPEPFWVIAEGDDLVVGWRGLSYRLGRARGLSVDQVGGRSGAAASHAGLEAPMPGTVIKVLVAEGDAVEAHQPLIVLEAMKMEHTVAAPTLGRITRLHVAVGTQVLRGSILAEIDEG